MTHSLEHSELRFTERLRHLNEVGLALSAERDIDRLLVKILSISRELTDSDAGSLFLVSKTAGDENLLHFREAQNDSVELDTKMTFAVSRTSLAGYVALTGEPLSFEDVYQLPPHAPYQFNPAFDKQHGYRTKSVLVVPLKNHDGDIIGVLQLINRKANHHVLLRDEATTEREVLPFDQESCEMAASLASQAAVALENNILLHKIEESFEKFVLAAASAIEDRDPSTSGHSERVTFLTLELANAATEATDGPFKDVHFTPQQIKELRYAGLLHDFGKIGVRENILTKSHKIVPDRFEAVKSRLLLLRMATKADFAERKVQVMSEAERDEAQPQLARLDAALEHELAEIDALMAVLLRANDPAVTYLPDAEYNELQRVLHTLATMHYENEKGERHPVLEPHEIEALSIRKGSLTRDEYQQIQSHARLSYEFLLRIPWTSHLEKIPEIAHCHHEKLNGKGYPRGVLAADIPLQARMMTVADIYDALTAADRPYKKAMSVQRALKILQFEAEEGGLDADVVELFISGKIYETSQAWLLSHLKEARSEGHLTSQQPICPPAETPQTQR